MGYHAEQGSHEVVLHRKGRVGQHNHVQEVVEGVDKAANVAQPAQKVISLSVDNLNSLVQVDLQTAEFVEAGGVA